MITEDYVSFETAKLLKEKEFPVKEVQTWYCEFDGYPDKSIVTNKQYPQITLQMAMKWLREVHKCYMHICPFYPESKYNEPPKWIAAVDYDGNGYPVLNEKLNTYEEACEGIITYCLINLI